MRSLLKYHKIILACVMIVCFSETIHANRHSMNQHLNQDVHYTSLMNVDMNLNANDTYPDIPFNKDNALSYNFVHSMHIYGKDKVDHHLSIYFIKQTYDVWNVKLIIDDKDEITSGLVTFHTSGQYMKAEGLDNIKWQPIEPDTMTLDLSATTAYAGHYTIRNVDQNGCDLFASSC